MGIDWKETVMGGNLPKKLGPLKKLKKNNEILEEETKELSYVKLCK